MTAQTTYQTDHSLVNISSVYTTPTNSSPIPSSNTSADTHSERSFPRPEHPRPDFVRQPWINLNGTWRFTFDPQNVGEQKRWHRVTHPDLKTQPGILNSDPFGDHIVVPFPWQSALSGIGETEYKGAAWYQRTLTVPENWANADAKSGPGDARGLPGVEESATSETAAGANVVWRIKPYLCFGAVDWSAKVWINGRFIGEHVGGYTPFELDISRYVRPGKPVTLTVRAYDACDADTLLGKQTEEWYTPSGGIWQTVWLEGRAPAHIAHIHVTPLTETCEALFSVSVAGVEGRAYRVTVTSPDGQFADAVMDAKGPRQLLVGVHVPEPRLWSPEHPHLYDALVRLTVWDEDAEKAQAKTPENAACLPDEVVTYFGLRTVARGRWKDNPYEYVLLNGEPVYLRGALDQAFHPDGLHTYSSDEAIRADVQLAKDLGLNMLRCHIKINEPRYYYWADRLGVLMMYDIPSASLYTPTARAHWEAGMRAAFERDASHPCIFAWILFNETWGLEEHQTPASWAWVAQMFDLARALDATRLIEDNSACLYDHVKTDINTWHFYISNYDRARRHIERVVTQTYEGSPFNYVGHLYAHRQDAQPYRQNVEPLLNSEYAGLGADGGDKDISYTFKYLTTDMRRHPKICGYVYTELTDIEWEHNGFVNYDRSAKEFGYEAFFPGMTVADLNGADFVGLDAPPCKTLAPGAAWGGDAFVSHWDKRPLENAVLCWRVSGMDSLGETLSVTDSRRDIQPEQYGVTPAGRIEFTCPNTNCLLTVAVWIEDGRGNVRARNYVNVDVFDGQPLAPVTRTPQGYALPFVPGDFVDTSRASPLTGGEGNKYICGGAGWTEYVVALPPDMDIKAVTGLRVRFEAGARSAHNRLGWKRTWQNMATSYPQTETRKQGSEVHISVNGVPLGTALLPDDPADARGVLSAHVYENFEFASYGFLNTLNVDADAARRILDAAQNDELTVRFEVPRSASAHNPHASTNGMNLYGARMGAYPVAPTVFLDTEPNAG